MDRHYSPETRNIRKKLWEYTKVKKADSNNRVRLKTDKLIVHEKKNSRDKEMEAVVPQVKHWRHHEQRKRDCRDLVAVVANCRSTINEVDEFTGLIEYVKADI